MYRGRHHLCHGDCDEILSFVDVSEGTVDEAGLQDLKRIKIAENVKDNLIKEIGGPCTGRKV